MDKFAIENLGSIDHEIQIIDSCSAKYCANKRHNKIIDKAIDNFGESGSNNESDSEVKDIATTDKLFEILKEI